MAHTPRCGDCGQPIHGTYCIDCAADWHQYQEDKNR